MSLDFKPWSTKIRSWNQKELSREHVIKNVEQGRNND